jgi:putative tryptophan/tyrosine transport system substrate-binding protein
MFDIRRREFITLLGGSAAAWPLAARAQQPERKRRVVFLHSSAEYDPEVQARIAAFRQALETLGWAENRNIQVDHRFSGGDFAQIQPHTVELVRSAPDLIVGSGIAVIAALKQATHSIPIVFNMVVDPVGQGLIVSLARPGGNVTGFTFFDLTMVGKWLEMLKEIAPNVRRMGFMFHPQIGSFYRAYMRELGTAATSLAADLLPMPVRDGGEIETAVMALAQEPGGGLIVATDPFMNTQRGLVMAMVERHRLPAIYGFQRFIREGALISYGPDSVDIVRRSASYVDRILKGEKPADLAVQAPTKYELGINLKSAKSLGLTVPPTLLAGADEVIE